MEPGRCFSNPHHFFVSQATAYGSDGESLCCFIWLDEKLSIITSTLTRMQNTSPVLPLTELLLVSTQILRRWAPATAQHKLTLCRQLGFFRMLNFCNTLISSMSLLPAGQSKPRRGRGLQYRHRQQRWRKKTDPGCHWQHCYLQSNTGRMGTAKDDFGNLATTSTWKKHFENKVTGASCEPDSIILEKRKSPIVAAQTRDWFGLQNKALMTKIK